MISCSFSRWLLGTVALVAVLGGCGDDDGPAGTPDGGGSDGSIDAGTRDGGGMDAGRESGPADTGPTDTGPADTGPADTGPVDTGPADTGTADGGGPTVIDCPEACPDGEICCPEGIIGRCIPAPEGGECPLPDLTVSSEALTSSAYVSWEYFAETDCSIVEGCVAAPGWRRLLRFSTQTPNVGTADMHLGVPEEGNPHFEYSACHMHYHFNGYADYRLLAADGTEAGHGHKQAFCLLDTSRWVTDDPTVARTPRYTCDDQGIQRGWSDVYDSSLDCQWIDITDVAEGEYTLSVAINYEHVLPELSYDNNTAMVSVTVPPDVPVDPLLPCERRLEGPNRDCGWSATRTDGTLNTFDCTPGATVVAGCGSTDCSAATCGGDPVMRICDGTAACESRSAIGQDDDCGPRNYCPAATAVCPESGKITVMTAPYTARDTYSCDVVAM